MCSAAAGTASQLDVQRFLGSVRAIGLHQSHPVQRPHGAITGATSLRSPPDFASDTPRGCRKFTPSDRDHDCRRMRAGSVVPPIPRLKPVATRQTRFCRSGQWRSRSRRDPSRFIALRESAARREPRSPKVRSALEELGSPNQAPDSSLPATLPSLAERWPHLAGVVR